MEFDVTYSNPHSVFISQTKRDELNVTLGQPLLLDFDGLDYDVVANCRDISEVKEEKETHSLFFILHYCADEFDSFHDHLFSDFESTDDKLDTEANESIQSFSEVRSYYRQISHLNQHRISDSEIIIGCGIADLLVDQEEVERYVYSPFSQHSAKTVHRGLKQELGELNEITRYEGEILTPGEIRFCTYQTDPTDEQLDSLKRHIMESRYIMGGKNYEIHYNDVPGHGPVSVEGVDVDLQEDDPVLLATEDNIEFTNRQPITIDGVGNDDVDLEFVKNIINNGFDSELNYSFETKIDDREISFDFGTSASANLTSGEEALQLSLVHGTDDDKRKANQLAVEIANQIEEQKGSEFFAVHGNNSPPVALVSDCWVLDTNSIYRQHPRENYNSIANFVITNPSIYNRKIKVPWNVLCEINRHKDSGTTRTQSASSQGVENLEMLQLLGSTDILDFEIENIPETIDNSVMKNTGISDLSILNSVPDGAVLFTDDGHLSSFASMMNIPVNKIEDISRFSDSNRDDQIWQTIQEFLSEDPERYDEILSHLHENLNEDLIKKDPENVISNKVGEGELVRMPDEDNDTILLGLSRVVKAIPTFDIVNSINSEVVSHNGDIYLKENTLEKNSQIYRWIKYQREAGLTLHNTF